MLSYTYYTLSYLIPLHKNTVTIALSQIISIGKYNSVGALTLGFGAGAIGGLTLGLIERDREQERVRPGATLLTLIGVMLLASGLNAIVYPVRQVNGPNPTWSLQVVR